MPKLFPVHVRDDFLDLVCSGASVSEAARRVGASRGTGKKWWAESGQMTLSISAHGGLADPAPSVEVSCGRALSEAERGMIQMGRQAGMSYAKIGAAIGRDKSVIWREVNRNCDAEGRYNAKVAHTRAHQARRRPKPFKLIEDEDLCRLIAVWMDDGWSPKLISSMLAFYLPVTRLCR